MSEHKKKKERKEKDRERDRSRERDKEDKKKKDKKDRDRKEGKEKDKKGKRGRDSRSPRNKSPSPEEVYAQFKQQFSQMQNIGKTAVSTAVKNVELKLANAKEFKTLFEAELNVILVRLENLKKMLADRVYNDETKDGIITIEL